MELIPIVVTYRVSFYRQTRSEIAVSLLAAENVREEIIMAKPREDGKCAKVPPMTKYLVLHFESSEAGPLSLETGACKSTALETQQDGL